MKKKSFSFLFLVSTLILLQDVREAHALLTAEAYFTRQAMTLSLQAKQAATSVEKSRLAKEGIKFADLCLARRKDSTACLYYRAINRGLDLETRTLGIKNDLGKMVADFKRVASLDETYDNGGAYRALGFVYLKLPALPILGGQWVRDLDLAKQYSDKSLRIAPQDPQNLLLAGQIAYENKNFSEAAASFQAGFRALNKKKSLSPDENETCEDLQFWFDKAKKKRKKGKTN